MPFLNEGRHLPAVLASLAEQSVDPARLYLIGVDNGSTDGGDAYFESWLAERSLAGLLVRDDVRSIPHALNTGLQYVMQNDIVVRLDAHTIYSNDYLETIDTAFATLPADVWCVGGAPTPQLDDDDYGRSLGIALYSNPLGLGPADFRKTAPRAAYEVSTVYLGAWRPGVLSALGGFDERWAANEDCELTERIRSLGGRIMRVPVRAGRIATRGPVATIVQWSRYGFWRMQTFKRYPQAVRPRHVAVPVALLAAIALLCSPLRLLLLPLYALYALATIRARRHGEPALVTAGTLLFFPLVHSGYASGLLAGIVRSPASLRSTARRSPGIRRGTPLRGETSKRIV
jgi:succinoglycan biosynthesis protein ExoA